MAARQNFYAESRTQTSTTSTTYGDKVALTFTPDANSDYVLMWCALIQNASNITADAKVRFFHDTASSVVNELNHEMAETAAPADYIFAYGIKRFQFGASPASQTWSIEFAAETAGDTINCKEASIIAIKMDAADQYAESEALSSTTSTTFQDKATLTFTPATAGDYLIICSSEGQSDAAANPIEVRLLDSSSTARGLSVLQVKDVLNWHSFGTFIRQNLAASSQTIKTQFRSQGGNNVDLQRSRVLALRLDKFANNYYAEDLTRTTTTSTTYVDKVTLTQTPVAGLHLKLFTGVTDGDSINNTSLWRGLEGSTDQGEGAKEPNNTSASDHQGITFKRDTLAASSTTWKTQFRTDNAAATCGFADSAISIIELNEAAVADDQITSETSLPPVGRTTPYSFDGWVAAPLALDNYESFSRVWETVPPIGLYREPHQGVQRFPLADDNEESFSRVWEALSPPGLYREPHQGEQSPGERPDFFEQDQQTLNRSWQAVPDGLERTPRFEGFQVQPLADDHYESFSREVFALPPTSRIDPHSYDGIQSPPLSADNYESFTRTWTEAPAGANPQRNPWEGFSALANSDEVQDFQAPVITDVPTGRNPLLMPWEGAQMAPLAPDFTPDTPAIQPAYPDFHFSQFAHEPHFIFDGFMFSPLPDDVTPPAAGNSIWRPTVRPRRR